jgi:hypothetical protein
MSNVLINSLYDAKESFSDITIQLQSGKTILCHKTILGAQSDYLKKMFSSKMKEGSLKVIKLEDDSNSVELMLKHMYYKEDTLTVETVVGLFIVAHKYEFLILTEKCKEFILKNLTQENSSTLFLLSKDYQWEELKENCLNLMYSEFEKIKDINELSFEDFSFILKSDKLVVSNEMKIFQKIEEWVLSDKERKKEMFKLFDLVDYNAIETLNILDLANGELGKSNEMKVYLFDIMQKKKKGELKSELTRTPPMSSLLSSQEKATLLGWIGGKRNWKLCYKATRDGFSAKTFRSLCSNKGETITIIKSSNGYVFGGYTPIPWDSSNTYKFNAKTFLFSMKNPGGTGPQKLENNGPHHSNQYSTYQGAGYGFDCFFNFLVQLLEVVMICTFVTTAT